MEVGRSVVILPTYNESGNIGEMIGRVLALPSAFDILVVDDNSPDGTAERVVQIQAGAGKERVHLIRREEKLGLGTAYCRGFAWALEKGYEFICQMDADFSHNPDDLGRLLDAARSADLALGSRYIAGGRCEGWSRFRHLLSFSANIYARTVIRLPYRDLTGGFKCWRRRALLSLDLTRIKSDGYAFQIETTTHTARAGYRIAEIPIVFRERRHGRSKFSKQVVWEAVWSVLRLGLS